MAWFQAAAGMALAQAASAQNYQFVDVTAAAGLDIPISTESGGIAVGDFDGDGWPDVSISGAADGRPQIFHNELGNKVRGDSRTWFTNVTSKVMPPSSTPATLAMFADLDNDADQDLVVVRRHLGPSQTYSHAITSLTGYENRGGRFRTPRVDQHANLGKFGRPLGGLSLADLDGDTDLDIVFTHSGGGGLASGSPGFHLTNRGGLRFDDTTAQYVPSLSTPRRYFSALLADFTGNGLPDLHSAVDFHPDYHADNVGGGQLVDVSISAGTTNPGSDMGLAIGDIDNDGDFDIYSTNINFGVLYVNDGNGKFTEEATARGVGGWVVGFCVGWGTAFVDFDLDMDQDLVCVGKVDPGHLFRNTGAGKFKLVPNHGMNLLGYNLVPFDYDRDGDMDVLVMDVSPTSPTPLLFENVSPIASGRHWLVVEPRGVHSSRDGVGAVVQVTAGGVTMTRPIVAGYSFRSGPPMNAHFGLADNTVADSVVITWPSGTVQTLTNVPADQYLEVVEAP
jgi:hypothetical protein